MLFDKVSWGVEVNIHPIPEGLPDPDQELAQTMTSRDRVLRALTQQPVDRIPIENGFSELQARHPSDVATPPYHYPAGCSWGVQGRKGQRMDSWGCLWEAGEDGVTGEVKDSPLRAGWEGLTTYKPPYEVLEFADLTSVNPACAASEQFMIPMWEASANPFERMQHLRGTEQLFLDLAYLEPAIYQLRTLVHDYFMRQFLLWVQTDIDAIHIADDWGAQGALLIAPALWRDFFKPLYRDYCDLAHQYGKRVVMHSDGYILDIIPDLIGIGVDALNAQLFCMPIEEIAAQYGGEIAFWGEIDRQYLLTHGTPTEVRAGVRRVADAFLAERRTGIVGQCFNGKDHRPENIAAVYDEWSRVSAEWPSA
jgi:uroporphyrinogen decarboxylase